jgi:hypothetical protein
MYLFISGRCRTNKNYFPKHPRKVRLCNDEAEPEGNEYLSITETDLCVQFFFVVWCLGNHWYIIVEKTGATTSISSWKETGANTGITSWKETGQHKSFCIESLF